MVQTVEVELYPGHWVCWGVIGLFVALAKGPRLEMLFSCTCTAAQRILLRRRLWCQILELVLVGANGGRRPRDCGDEPGGRLIGIRSGQVKLNFIPVLGCQDSKSTMGHWYGVLFSPSPQRRVEKFHSIYQ
ncbi:hypothetical protein VFPPC_15987 [Pochonia chlamydosporia 170]|uniref:Uncharacterized protein n=1 Tax=Pochonia chlamydosporia 170 TaxID=1380566 RepID=A0A179FKM7_METCM|nr:hypothetical protein VFPPC_15987 [Pochonia chlamydosporia 170]OAQ66132.1 hypothetical protein VFPPC_15987 [Pochonia chlamydosporia 170]